jgi:alkanesulfonate monooxygenase SsuD/methylene tetrahydromethanopterin reductase-like flavin-dependent oxidoreductase (luciferase family)
MTHVTATDAEAIEVAARLAGRFAREAAWRDAEHILPRAGLEELPDSGLLGIGGIGPVVVGSPATVADEPERWVEEADIDGLDLAYAITPGTFADSVDPVVPELRARGWMPDTDGSGGGSGSGTLRERVHGPGSGPGVRDDHPAARHRELAARERQRSR